MTSSSFSHCALLGGPVPYYEDKFHALLTFGSEGERLKWARENKAVLVSNGLRGERVWNRPEQARLFVDLEGQNQNMKINSILERLGMPCANIPSQNYTVELQKDLATVYEIGGASYRINRLISDHGCYGDVFLAENVDTEEKVAIKVLRVEGDKEAEMLEKIQKAGGHPNIVKYIASGKIIDRIAIVMEYIEGRLFGGGLGDLDADLRAQYEDAYQFLRAAGARREDENERANLMLTKVNGAAIIKLIDFGTLGKA